MYFERIVTLCAFLQSFEPVKGVETPFDSNAETALKKFFERHFNDCFSFVGDTRMVEKMLGLDTPRILYEFQGETHTKTLEELGKTCDNFIVLYNGSEGIETTAKNLLNIANFRRHYRSLIIPTEIEGETDIKTIFLTLWKYYVYNVVVYAGKGVFYTWYPYGEKNKCGTEVNLVKITEDERPFEGKIPGKVHGCNLSFTYKKTWSIIADPSDKEEVGILNDVLDVMQEKMNLTVVFLNNNTDYIDQYLRHMHYNVLVDDMKKRRIDLGYVLKLMYRCSKRSNRLEGTKPFLILPLNFILPPREEKPIVIYVINLFQHVLLYCVATTFLVVCILLKVFTRRPALVIVLETLQLNLQQALRSVPSNRRARFVLAMFLLYNICIYTAWQSGLSSSLTKPSRKPKIDTLKALAKSELHVYAYVSFLNCSLTHRKNKYIREILEKTHPIPQGQWNQHLGDFIKNPRNATIASIQVLPVKNPEALEVITKETVNIFALQIAARPGFPLKPRMNYWMDRMTESGILQAISRTRMKKIHLVPVPERKQHIKLTASHLKRVFFILMTGLALSTLILLAELFVFHRN